MELIGKKEFTASVFCLDNKIFIVHIVFLASFDLGLEFYFVQQAQIASLKVEQTPTFVFFEYANFPNVFAKDIATKLPEHTGINNHIINFVKSKQPPIYRLKPMELEILKVYIKTNLVNGFIKPSKSLADTIIFFVKKLNNSLWLYID